MLFSDMTMRKVVLILILISNSVLFSQNKYLGKSNWVNIEYLNCIQENLPCKCIKFHSIINFIKLNIDSVNNSFNRNDYLRWKVNSDTLFFELVDFFDHLDGKDSAYGKGFVINDTLVYSDLRRNQVRRYIKNDTLKYFDDFPQTLIKINNQLRLNGEKTIHEILNEDTLFFDCDLQFSINRIHNDSLVWLVEINYDYLFIYSWKYPDELGKRARKNLIEKIYIGKKD